MLESSIPVGSIARYRAQKEKGAVMSRIGRRLAAGLAAMALLLVPAEGYAKGGGHGGNHSSLSHSSNHSGHHNAQGVTRDAHGKTARSGRARAEFKKTHACPSTGRSSGGCPGYVIDHVVPLKRGGPDRPSNMQWQTKAEATAKDRVE